MKTVTLLSLLTLTFSLTAVRSAHATMYTTIDCLSQTQTSDLRIGLKDIQKIDYAEKYDGLRGQMTSIKNGKTIAYNNKRFSFAGTLDEKPMSLEFDLNSPEMKNGVLTVGGKAEKTECYISDLNLDD